ncbi:MAG: hypothetical protein A3K10_01650 [Bacteroidetes bacterium RIFCSPLOWO2_12_FULL_31_6]|nr:MAG: hypothetical protein A3K10_01650 [Bacteroidetes bacterium RIFCSPLOWO2_12_FULL_31_6]
MELTFHHTGIVVDNIDEVAENYKSIFGENSISKKYYVATQGVNVCFISVGSGVYLELVESATDNSLVSKLRRKGQTYYHVGYLTNDIEESFQLLSSLNYMPLELFKSIEETSPSPLKNEPSDFFKSEAFEGKRCVFLLSPDGHLIELVEK